MHKRINKIISLIFLILAYVVFISSYAYTENKIIYPRLGVPLIIKRGEAFNIQLSLLNHDLKKIEAKLVSVETNEDEKHSVLLKVKNIEVKDNKVVVSVETDKNTPIDLYSLVLKVIYDTDQILIEEERCIKIVNEYKNDFFFIVMADVHLKEREFVLSRSAQPNVEKVKSVINQVNLLNPEFVVICGDNLNGYDYDEEYELLKQVYKYFQVPTFIVPGNHDGYVLNVRKQKKFVVQDGLEYYKKYIGDLYYTANYGNFKILAINTFDKPPEERTMLGYFGGMSEKQFEFVENELKNWTAKDKILFMHHSIHDKEWKQDDWNRMYNIINNYKVDYVFSGHEHQDKVIKENFTTFIWNASSSGGVDAGVIKRQEKGYEGFRKVEVRDGKIFSFNYEEPQYSIPADKIGIKAKNNMYVFKNELKDDVVLSFKVVLPPNKKISNKNISVLQKVKIPKGIKYYLQIKVPANKEKRIKL